MLLVGAIVLAVFVLQSPWNVVAVAAASAVEIGETFFWIRLSRRRAARVGAETLIGARAVTTSECRPQGQVRLRGELWQARCPEGAGVGEAVRVVGREGLSLLVEPETRP